MIKIESEKQTVKTEDLSKGTIYEFLCYDGYFHFLWSEEECSILKYYFIRYVEGENFPYINCYSEEELKNITIYPVLNNVKMVIDYPGKCE